MNHMWRNGILGVVVGDALGCPVQFESRKEVLEHPITGMRGYGTFNLPEGSWTDDSSLTLALLDSINKDGNINFHHIMDNFVEWLDNGQYTPYGYSYDIGRGTINAINAYKRIGNPYSCGGRDEDNNGDGSLMRIMPVCLYCYNEGLKDGLAISNVHGVGMLTHAHLRANIACGLYYFIVKSILSEEGTLFERIQKGLEYGFSFYDWHNDFFDAFEVNHYKRLRDFDAFATLDDSQIRSSGYVVDAFEAAIWSLAKSGSYKDALLKAVNLGLDTDTVGAIAGGLGGLYYGIGGEKGIPTEWIDALQKKEYILEMCDIAEMEMQKK